MLTNKFDVLLTFDQNIAHQQNFDKYPIAVIILIAPKNTYEVLAPLVPHIKTELNKPLRQGGIIVSS